MPEPSRRVAGDPRAYGEGASNGRGGLGAYPAIGELIACWVLPEPPYAGRHIGWRGRWESQGFHLPDPTRRRVYVLCEGE